MYMVPSTESDRYDPNKEQLFSTENSNPASGHICGNFVNELFLFCYIYIHIECHLYNSAQLFRMYQLMLNFNKHLC